MVCSIQSSDDTLQEVRNARSKAWKVLDDLLTEKRALRQALLTSVMNKSGRLRFKLKPHRDVIGWTNSIRELLNLRADSFLEDVPQLGRWIWDAPEGEREDRWGAWREALVTGAFDSIAGKDMAIPRSDWQKRLEKVDPAIRMRLACEVAEDSIEIAFLRDGGRPDKDEDWQDISEGSPGQRTAAMLGFVLHHGDGPLVLDQPEDDLDTEWISSLVVQELRASRWKRQLIVVTHNANIPVIGDAERVVVLENKAGALRIRDSYLDGRLNVHIGAIEVSAVRADTYAFNSTYNTTTGLLETFTYPTSTSSTRVKLRYSYQNGEMQSVRDYTGNVLGTVYWQANSTDASSGIIDEQLGNGLRTISSYDRITGLLESRTTGPGGGATRQNSEYYWDKVGNLTQRRELNLNLIESFYYDSLDRLDYSQLNGATNLDVAYNAIGNITSKTGVGAYTYHATKKHAVVTAGSNTYTYDANGNMITRNGGSITWASYDLPTAINQTDGQYSQFSYGADRSRYKQVSFSTTFGAETTIYIGALFERVTRTSGTEYKHYVSTPSGRVAVINRKSSGTNEVYYLLRDHLGSTEMITNSAGGQMTRASADAFGKRRNGGTWAGTPAVSAQTTFYGTTHDGFTGHEHLDNLDLIHMNGRVYDPIVGRFMSADPFVTSPYASQSLNRYSYTLNNPLRYTDPSGFMEGGRGRTRWDAGVGLEWFPAGEWVWTSGSQAPWSIDESEYAREAIGSYVVVTPYAPPGNSAPAPSPNPPTQTPPPTPPPATPPPQRTPLPPVTLPGPAAGVPGLGSAVGRFANDGVMNPIYLPSGTVAMSLPRFVYQQCAMSMCHGNTDLPFTHGYLDDERSHSLAIDAGITVFGWPIGGGARLIPWSSRAIRTAVEALEVGATEVRVGSRSEAAELFLGRYQGAGYRNTTGWSPRQAKDFFGSKAGTYHWDEGLNAFPHDASHLQIHTLEGPVIRIYFPD